jgi:hypothetical protein
MSNSPVKCALHCAIILTLAACQPSATPTASGVSTMSAASAPVTSTSSAAPPASSATAGATASASAATTQAELLDTVATATDTLPSLRDRYGAANIKAEKVPGAEGEELPGWILYPDVPERRVYIYPDESGTHPSLLRVLDGESTWRRSDGIRMGMTLAELVVRNGRPIQFSGFGWDYGGAIHDWHGGALEKGAGGLTLCPPEFADGQYPENYPSGDAEFSSADALVVRYPPTVCEFTVVLASPGKS